MAWNGLRMTVDGRNALNQAQMADKMLFKSIVVGDGQPPANFNTQRALVHQLYEITAIQVDVRGDMCVLTADFPAVDYDYYFREIGVVAQTEDGDKLYVYDNCGEDAQYIVTTTGTEKTRKRIRISLKISDVAEITVVNPEILCVAYDDFDKLVEKVKEKVAAVGGDVASTIASAFTESKDPYPIPQAGESIKVILGKVVKFFNDVKTGCCKIGDIVNNCTSTDTDKPLAAAVGKVLWDKIVDAVAALGTHKSSADHDGRYYTETEMDTKLGGKANTNHGHSSSTQSVNGFMSAADKKKLDGMATNANNYSHPTSSGNKHIPSGGSSGQILRWSADGTATWGSDNNTTYGAATQSANGLMSAADKKKLDGITVVNNTADSNKSVKYAASAGNSAKVGGRTWDSDTDNVNDSWLLVMNNDKVQHRRVETLPFAPTSHSHSSLSSGGSIWLIGPHRAVGLFTTRFCPGTHDGSSKQVSLGSSDSPWSNVYSSSALTVTSDRRKKKEIKEFDPGFIKSFIMGIKPVSFKFIENQSDRTHYGMISQDIEELLEALQMPSSDFAGFIKSPKEEENYDENGDLVDVRIIEGEYNYGLRYEEFISPLIKMVQMQQKEIEELKVKIGLINGKGEEDES